MVDTTVGAAAADGICIDTPTPLSAKSNNKTGIQKGIFLIFHSLLSFSVSSVISETSVAFFIRAIVRLSAHDEVCGFLLLTILHHFYHPLARLPHLDLDLHLLPLLKAY